MHEALAATDPQLSELIAAEEARQAGTLCMIASENYTSQAVLEASGTVLMNKYSEGYPGKRYYEGNQYIDEIESLAIERAKALFGADHVNVQPYSGSPANLAIYLAFANPGDTIMGMSLPDGGHLTHGWSVSATGRWFRAVHYGVERDTEQIDLDRVRDLARRERPRLIFCGGTAIPRIIDFAGFAEIAREVEALLVADISHIAGLVAGGAHPSPVPHADVVMTTTHKTLRGPRGAMLMCRAEHAAVLDKAVFPGLQGGPHQQQVAALAVALKEAATPAFREYAHGIVSNARALAEALGERGFRLVSGGTDNHLILIDLTNKEISGKQAASALNEAGLVTNANTVPFDPRKPFDPSGLRIGTAGLTSRGLVEDHMIQIADWMQETVAASLADDGEELARIRRAVEQLCERFPAPGLLTPAVL